MQSDLRPSPGLGEAGCSTRTFVAFSSRGEIDLLLIHIDPGHGHFEGLAELKGLSDLPSGEAQANRIEEIKSSVSAETWTIPVRRKSGSSTSSP